MDTSIRAFWWYYKQNDPQATRTLSQNYSPVLQIKPREKLMWECKINNVHSENSDSKEHILKLCLPAPPFLSAQKVFGQRNVPWFSSCKIKLAECSLVWRHFCKSFEQSQIWSGVWPSNPCSPHYFRPLWVQDCNHGAPTALVAVTQEEKGGCTYPSDDM